jgi:hypothetical protein
LRSVQRALKEALLALPEEEYDWFDVRQPGAGRPKRQGETDTADLTNGAEILGEAAGELHEAANAPQKDFFEFAGPLFSVRISPSSSVLPVSGSKRLRAIPRDRSNRQVEQDLTFLWEIVEGAGRLEATTGEIVTFHAGAEPGLTTLRVTARQHENECRAEALVTVTDSLLPESPPKSATKQGLPSYTFQKAPGELWRARFQADQNVIVINNGHRDFVYASRNKVLKLRYICRLFAKELVVKNFTGLPPGELLERLIELSLYTEENLK